MEEGPTTSLTLEIVGKVDIFPPPPLEEPAFFPPRSLQTAEVGFSLFSPSFFQVFHFRREVMQWLLLILFSRGA